MRFIFIFVLGLFVSFASTASETVLLSAEAGLELNQLKHTITALDSAKAVRGDLTFLADKITAHYREVKNDQQIYRLVAEGNVRVSSTDQKIETDRLVYDLDSGKMTLQGAPITRLYHTGTVLSSKDQIVYNDKTHQAVATNASLKHEERVITSPRLIAYFNEGNKMALKQVVSEGGIKLKTDTEELSGKRAVYDPVSGFAKIEGAVRLVKGKEVSLTGGLLHYNMKTGTTRLHAAEGQGKVQGKFNVSE